MADAVTIEKYETELRQKSKDCEFSASENDMKRDKIVFSLYDQWLKERLLRESNLTLEKAIDLCRAAETTKAQIQAMTTRGQERATHAVNNIKGKDIQQWKQGPRQQAQSFNNKGKDQMCRKCGKSHPPRPCPAFGVSCQKCGKLNHYAKMCESAQATYKKTVHDLAQK